MKYLIEIAVTDYNTARAAVAGGADRIELCTALSEGGLTPSYSLVKRCLQDFSVPVFPIVRPRAGDFLYNEEEFWIMQQDVLACKQLGCSGIVAGFLMQDGTIDHQKTGVLRELAYPMQMTFHRAFDRARDPYEGMETLIRLGCERILTSGQQVTAPQALPLIKDLIHAADGRITIMPGSGIR
ncbi:MAG: copper homeostasis protein CutC, partial [Williamsia sp.]|nr:copper homeostasis protein CutC [Williamsia sp.]